MLRLPQPYADVARSSLYVPARDGTRLAVNIYRPAQGSAAVDKPLPVIFAFTPYRARFKDDKGKVSETALNDQLALRSLIRAGYVVAVADIRGKGASFGSRRGFQDRTEANDGHDLIQWLAKQPFSDGKVGMLGCSYLGGTTLHVTSTAPPALKSNLRRRDRHRQICLRPQRRHHGHNSIRALTRPPAVDLASVPVDGKSDGTQPQGGCRPARLQYAMAPLWYGMPWSRRQACPSSLATPSWEEAGPILISGRSANRAWPILAGAPGST